MTQCGHSTLHLTFYNHFYFINPFYYILGFLTGRRGQDRNSKIREIYLFMLFALAGLEY
jgi:hypothetical protein